MLDNTLDDLVKDLAAFAKKENGLRWVLWKKERALAQLEIMKQAYLEMCVKAGMPAVLPEGIE